jgi:UDP-N-acetylmuramate-alanine ligase
VFSGHAGKSTTVAMLAVALCILGEDITVILGAQVPQFPKGRNAMVGKGHLFLLEADEYDGCFLGVSPSLAVVTNVEWEHVDMFPDYEAVRDMFRKFVMRIKPGGLLLVNGDRLQFTR